MVASALGMWYFIPYALLSLGMRANDPNRSLDLVTFIVSNIIFIAIFYLLSVLYLKKTDVKTH